MKTQIRKCLMTVIAVCITLLVFSQTDNRFYASLEDFQNDKPAEGIKIEPDSRKLPAFTKTCTFEIITNGNSERKKMSTAPYSLYTYQGRLMRNYKNIEYIVLVSGPLCYYANYGMNNDQYYSETIKGELLSISESKLRKYLKQYGLLEAYKKDKPKREFHDSVNDYWNKLVERYIKYFKLLNEKMK